MSLRIAIVSAVLLATGYAQTPGDRSKKEFEVASIRVNPPQTGFRFASSTGAPDLSNPGLFRCTNCTLATLISKAFDLQGYQLPGKASLGNGTFDVTAKIPAGTNPEDFQAMLQSLLKDRFGLTYHYKDKTMRGYHLVVGKNGPKLKESTEMARVRPNGAAGQHGAAQGQDHEHAGLMNFGGTAMYRGDHKTTAELAQILSDQLSVPVDDQTKLTGKYDISLRWSASVSQSGGNHTEGGAGHGERGGGGPAGAAGAGPRRGEDSAPTLFEALQTELGLKLVSSDQAVAKTFIVDHAEQVPTAN